MQIKVEANLPSLALDILKRIVDQRPTPQANTDTARMAAQAIGNHLIFLIQTASDANVSGRHSVAVSLFRNMEDALDCFAAAALLPGAAEKWFEGKLKASEAAKLCHQNLGPTRLPNGSVTMEYRKGLRKFFNEFAHCTPLLIEWDLYPHFTSHDIRQLANDKIDGSVKAELRVNTRGILLQQNGIRIGAFLLAHTLEFLEIVCVAYDVFIRSNSDLQTQLASITGRLRDFIEDNWTAVYLETHPPEIKTPRIPNIDNISLSMDLPRQEK